MKDISVSSRVYYSWGISYDEYLKLVDEMVFVTYTHYSLYGLCIFSNGNYYTLSNNRIDMAVELYNIFGLFQLDKGLDITERVR